MPFTSVCSVTANLNLDRLLEETWAIMKLTRVYTKVNKVVYGNRSLVSHFTYDNYSEKERLLISQSL
jgi:hypothetical protein